uniref:Uncharacterized protein n=1 Tax=Romanomermis culicivorax TaxID=13658 RepID=A0A915K278_ROMCU
MKSRPAPDAKGSSLTGAGGGATESKNKSVYLSPEKINEQTIIFTKSFRSGLEFLASTFVGLKN